MRNLLLVIVAVIVSAPACALAATPARSPAHLQARLATLTKERDAARASVRHERRALAAMTASRNLQRARASGANASLDRLLAAYAGEQGKLGSSTAALAGSLDDQIGVLDAGALWQVLTAIDARLMGLADSRYSATYTAGDSLTFAFVYTPTPSWAAR